MLYSVSRVNQLSWAIGYPSCAHQLLQELIDAAHDRTHPHPTRWGISVYVPAFSEHHRLSNCFQRSLIAAHAKNNAAAARFSSRRLSGVRRNNHIVPCRGFVTLPFAATTQATSFHCFMACAAKRGMVPGNHLCQWFRPPRQKPSVG